MISIMFQIGEAEDLWVVHAALMSFGLLLLFIGIIIAKFLKQKKWWLNRHHVFEFTGFILIVIGFSLGFYMVSADGGHHFDTIHSIIAIIVIILFLISLISGFAIFKIKSKSKPIRVSHRWLSLIALLLTIITAILGLFLID